MSLESEISEVTLHTWHGDRLVIRQAVLEAIRVIEGDSVSTHIEFDAMEPGPLNSQNHRVMAEAGEKER